MSNYSEQISIAINDRPNTTPFLVDARGIVTNVSHDLIGYTSGATQRGEITYPADGATEVFKIASSDVNDTLLGSGARTITVLYLDGDGNLLSHDAELDGQTPVNLPAAFRILAATVQTGGVIATPIAVKTAGDISIGKTFTLGIPSEVYCQISPLTGQCNSGTVTVPANHRAVFQAAFASGPKNDDIEFLLFSKATGEQWISPAGFFSGDVNNVTGFVVNAFDGLQDLELRAKSTSGNAEVHVLFNVIFVPA